MSWRLGATAAIVGVLVGAAALAGVQPVPPNAQGRQVEPLRVRDLEDRLRELDPADPEAYFLLGEEVSAEAMEPEHLELAKTLFVLAFHMDRQRARPTWISSSACLALADVSRLERERRWLMALAKAIDARQAPPDWNYADPIRASDETAYQAATAVGLVRSGHGRQARELFQKPEVRSLLVRFESLLHPAALPGEAGRLEREAEKWPCPECGNDRVVRRPGVSPPEYAACLWCKGDPGMKISLEEFVGQLRFESRLLSGVHRSWSAQVASDAGLPLRDPDPEELAATLGVDVRKVFWRDGKWTDEP